MASKPFNPALIIVDLQEDFCPPNGSLAIPNGRDTVPAINKLLDLPFALKIATKDWHPSNHISFASSHANKKPFSDSTTITNPKNPAEQYESQLWPDHCIQHTPGAALLPELHIDKIDKVVEKGQMREVEMYSAFYTPLTSPRIGDSGLAALLREHAISDVFVVGLAFDYCVRATAVDAASEGFRTWVVGEGTRGTEGDGMPGESTRRELEGRGVGVVGVEGEEVGWVRELRDV